MRFLGAMALLASIAATGCGEKIGGEKKSSEQSPPKKDADEHVHGKGPSGGVVFDLGKYHGEFTVDHDKKSCKLVVLGSDMKTIKSVACKELTVTTMEAKTKDGNKVEPMTIKLTPADEKDGKATTFTGTDPGLGNVADFEGTVLGAIEGKPVKGTFKE